MLVKLHCLTLITVASVRSFLYKVILLLKMHCLTLNNVVNLVCDVHSVENHNSNSVNGVLQRLQIHSMLFQCFEAPKIIINKNVII